MKLFRQVNCIFLVPAEKLDCITCCVGRCEIWDVRNKLSLLVLMFASDQTAFVQF